MRPIDYPTLSEEFLEHPFIENQHGATCCDVRGQTPILKYGNEKLQVKMRVRVMDEPPVGVGLGGGCVWDEQVSVVLFDTTTVSTF